MNLLTLFLLLISSSTDTLYLDLNQALQTALKKSPQAAEASVARLQSWLAFGQGINPALPAPQANITRSKELSGQALWSTNLTISQVLFDPAVFANFINGIVNARYHSLDAREKIAALIFQTTTDYLNLLKAQLLLDAAEKGRQQAAENLNYTTERYRLGQASRIDLLRSEVFYSQAQINLLNAQKNAALSQEKFRATAGINRPQFIRATEQLTSPADFPITDPDSLLAAIEHINPNVQMSQNLNTAARLNLGAAFARILPAISFYRSWATLDTTLPQNYRAWKETATRTDGIHLSFPVADIKTFLLAIGDALAGSRRARAALARTRFQLRAAAQSALLDLQEAKLRCAEAKRNLELNQELYNLARTQHELGAFSLNDLLEVEVNLAQAEVSYLTALCDTYIQTAQIGYLLGKTDSAARAR
jgi:outer membrane protein TolC